MADDYTLGELYRRQADHERRTEAALTEIRRQIQTLGTSFVNGQLYASERAADMRSTEALYKQLAKLEAEAKERDREIEGQVEEQGRDRRRLLQLVLASFIAPVVVGVVLYAMIGR